MNAHPPGRGPAKLLGLLLFAAVIALLPTQALYWDGLAFLQAARPPLELDYGHFLYVPLLRAAHAVLAPWIESEVFSARLVSAVAAGGCLVLLWARAERTGLAASEAVAAALLVVTTPLFWRQADVVEPATLTIAALLCAWEAARRYGERRSALRLALLCASMAALLGLHLAAVFALPWLVDRARGPAPRPPASHLVVPAGLVLAVLAAGALAGDLGAFLVYWRGFLPPAAGFAAAVGEHARMLGRVLTEGTPVLSAAGALGVVVLVARERAGLRGPALLAAPFLVAFLVLGKPVVGLLLPVTVALGAVVARAAALTVAHPRTRAVAGVALAVLVAVQGTAGLVGAARRALTPDRLQEVAVLIAGALPRDAVVLAGPVAHHLRWHTGAPVVALPNAIHAARSRDAAADPVHVVVAEGERLAASYAAVYVTSGALDYLGAHWGADAGRLPLDWERALVVSREPDVRLVPLVPRGDD